MNGLFKTENIGNTGGGSGGLTALLLEHCVLVSENGNDATGARNDWSKPFLTPQAALLASQNTDTLIFMPGTYNGYLEKFGGSYARKIVMINATLTASDPSRPAIGGVWINCIIEGIGKSSIINANPSGEALYMDSTDLEISNLTLASTNSNGIRLRGNISANECSIIAKAAGIEPLSLLMFNIAAPLVQTHINNCKLVNTAGSANAYSITQTSAELAFIDGCASNLPMPNASYIFGGINTVNTNLAV